MPDRMSLSFCSTSRRSSSNRAIWSPTFRMPSILAWRSVGSCMRPISFDTALRSALSVSVCRISSRRRSSSAKIWSTGSVSIWRNASDLRTRSGCSRSRLRSNMAHLHLVKYQPPRQQDEGAFVVPPAFTVSFEGHSLCYALTGVPGSLTMRLVTSPLRGRLALHGNCQTERIWLPGLLPCTNRQLSARGYSY
jgi:hypothetical protein